MRIIVYVESDRKTMYQYVLNFQMVLSVDLYFGSKWNCDALNGIGTFVYVLPNKFSFQCTQSDEWKENVWNFYFDVPVQWIRVGFSHIRYGF